MFSSLSVPKFSFEQQYDLCRPGWETSEKASFEGFGSGEAKHRSEKIMRDLALLGNPMVRESLSFSCESLS